mgnify:CR=1 FL=1
MYGKALEAGSKYILQHCVNKVLSKVSAIHNKINPDYSVIEEGISSLKMNDIASVSFQLNKPIFFDSFKENDIVTPEVSIAIEYEDDQVHLVIRDNAGGIPEDIIESIFLPYFSTKSEKNGTGLGLYMSKMIIEKNMGAKLGIINHKDVAEFIIEF